MSDQSLPVTSLSQLIDGVVIKLGSALGWIWLLLIGVIVVNVISRYLFSEGFIELEELQWHLYAVGWLVGLSSTYVVDLHVRVDVLTDSMAYKRRLWFEFFGILLLFLPAPSAKVKQPFSIVSFIPVPLSQKNILFKRLLFLCPV